MEKLIRKLASWIKKRKGVQLLINLKKVVVIERYHLMWEDEYLDPATMEITKGKPHWFPFNCFLHRWIQGDTGLPHTHASWNITIMLSGRAIEVIDRERIRYLRPGSIVFRGRKKAHRILIPRKYLGKTWTLFIVGSRKWAQKYLTEEGKYVNAALKTSAERGIHLRATGFSGETCLPEIDSEKVHKVLPQGKALRDYHEEYAKEHREQVDKL